MPTLGSRGREELDEAEADEKQHRRRSPLKNRAIEGQCHAPPNSALWSQQGQNAHISDASPAYSSIHEAASSGQMAWNKRMGGSN